MQRNKILSVYIYPEERDLVLAYTKVPLNLIEKISHAITAAQQKRAAVKKVKVHYSLKELDIVLKQVAITSNYLPSSSIKYQLNSLFGRLATKYNEEISNKL